MLARAFIGSYKYFEMSYHENIWFPNAGKILTVYIILEEFREISLAHIYISLESEIIRAYNLRLTSTYQHS